MRLLGKLHRGWIRLWIVASVLMTLAIFVKIYPSEENQRTYFNSGYERDQIKTGNDERMAIEDFFSRPFIPEEARNCYDKAYLWPLIENSDKSPMVIKCPRSTFERIATPLLVSAMYSAFLFFVGLVVSWIRKGFSDHRSGA